jgi:hypothetical protein
LSGIAFSGLGFGVCPAWPWKAHRDGELGGGWYSDAENSADEKEEYSRLGANLAEKLLCVFASLREILLILALRSP